MQRLFLDANVLLSFYFSDAEKNQQKAIDTIISSIDQNRYEGVISIISLYQLMHFIDSKERNPKLASSRAYAFLDILELAPFNPIYIKQINSNLWPDYEDGLQYACALGSNIDFIITTNGGDFFSSQLPVVDPLNFVILQNL
ncbi:MAG: PIN domain-containing protein [Bacteroidota bacterium]